MYHKANLLVIAALLVLVLVPANSIADATLNNALEFDLGEEYTQPIDESYVDYAYDGYLNPDSSLLQIIPEYSCSGYGSVMPADFNVEFQGTSYSLETTNPDLYVGDVMVKQFEDSSYMVLYEKNDVYGDVVDYAELDSLTSYEMVQALSSVTSYNPYYNPVYSSKPPENANPYNDVSVASAGSIIKFIGGAAALCAMQSAYVGSTCASSCPNCNNKLDPCQCSYGGQDRQCVAECNHKAAQHFMNCLQGGKLEDA